MGDFGVDTAVSGDDGRYTATLSRDWEIWGPNGGYLAAVALRAAGAHATLPRPANVAVHFLGSPRFEEVELVVETIKPGRRAEFLRVTMNQGGRAMLTLQCWAVADELPGLVHDHVVGPDTPHWRELPTVEERIAAAGLEHQAPYRFWDNLEERPTTWFDNWEDRPAGEPVWRTWLRFRPTPDLSDPWLDAARTLLLVDLGGWPATNRAYQGIGPWIAPSLDVSCQFNGLAPASEWLLVECVAPIAADGLLGATGRVWDEHGRLLGTGVTQMLFTPVTG